MQQPLPRTALLSALLAAPLCAQVDYNDNGYPWTAHASNGPDSVVPGWFYNLGPTGMRAQLDPERPTHLLVKHVFERTPAARHVEAGDWIVGVNGVAFETPHVDGYGMDVFATRGPLHDFADALEASYADDDRIELQLERDGKPVSVSLRLGRQESYAASFPVDCDKSEQQLEQLLEYVVRHQRDNGSWGREPQNTFAPLALLASGERRYRSNVERAARWHAANTTGPPDESSLVNWKYMGAAIVLSEYYLATGERWVLPELEEIAAFLHSSQYTDRSQIHPRSPETHPHDQPRDELDRHGGWGHNPGFEGYGPIAMITAQGALAFSLMERCGIEIEPERHRAAYAYLERGTGRNGYLWYGDSVAGQDDWADTGRTGAAAIAQWLSPFEDEQHRALAMRNATLIGEHPESFPDTHASPLMGMGWVAIGAHVDPPSYRRLMDANRWWFVLAEAHDGSFCYQPNRDNSNYDSGSRLLASATTALILSVPQRSLVITGK